MIVEKLMLEFRKYVEAYPPEELYGEKLIMLFREFISLEAAQHGVEPTEEGGAKKSDSVEVGGSR